MYLGSSQKSSSYPKTEANKSRSEDSMKWCAQHYDSGIVFKSG